MQTSTLKRGSKRHDGSTLVGVIALCAVMAIGAAGLMGISRNTTSQEVDAHNDAAAYLAAETGLLRGTAWFRDRGVNAPPLIVGPAFPSFNHNGITVDVAIVGPDPTDGQYWRLRSTAWHPGLGYGKQLEWALFMQAQTNPAVFGYFVDRANDEEGCATGSTGGYDGFRANVVYEAPVHFNGPIRLDQSDDDQIRFLDRVTVFNPPRGEVINGIRGIFRYQGVDPNPYGIGAPPRSNNYQEGVEWNKDPNNLVAKLDDVFESTYRTTHEQFEVTFVTPTVDDEGVDGDGVLWHFLPTPSTGNVAGSFLKFGVNGGVAPITSAAGLTNILANATNRCNDCYTFFQRTASNNWTPIHRKIPQDGTELIIQAGRVNFPTNAPFELQVRDGTMSGEVSVRTVGNQDIIIDLQNNTTNTGRLMYNITDAASRNIIMGTPTRATGNAGAHRIKDYVERYKGVNYGLNSTEDILAFYSDRHIRFTTPSGNPTPNQAHVTAQLFTPNGQTYPADNNSNFTYNIFGALISKCWWNYSGNSNINDLFRVFHDQRMKKAPGVGMGDPDGDDGEETPAQLFIARWNESNVAGPRP